jgi:hypothetical protein
MPHGTREEGEPITKVGLSQPLAEHKISFAAYVMQYHELWLEARNHGAQLTEKADVPRRSIFDRLPAEAQVEMRRRADGASSQQFLECMTWTSMCRVVYRTRSGLVGMGSRITKPGDVVCRVRGSPVFMTLRRANGEQSLDSESALWVHICPTIVPARMKKGVVDGAEFGETPARFRII